MLADPDNPRSSRIELQFGTTMEKFLDFVEDAGRASASSGKPSGGIVATLRDEAVAARRVQALLGLMAIASGGANAQFSVSNEVVNGSR